MNYTDKSYIQVFWDRLQEDLKITQAGMLMLQNFDYFIVMQGYRAWSLGDRKGCPVKSIAKNCHNLCKEKGITVTWAEYYKKLKSLNLDQNSPLTRDAESHLQNEINKPPIKSNLKSDPEKLKKALALLGKDGLPPEVLEMMQKLSNENNDLEPRLTIQS